jgi:hypothetical protein
MTLSRTIVLTFLVASFAARADISRLGWMTGCWALVGQDAGSIEQWSSPAGRMMLGFSRVVSDGETVAFEYLRIVDEGNDVLALIASPSGQTTARFEATELANDKVIFENSEHDFPQRIIYRLNEDGDLMGRIEGLLNGAPRTADFPMRKTVCNNGEITHQQ